VTDLAGNSILPNSQIPFTYHPPTADEIAVRALLDANDKNSTPVSAVISSSDGGRITGLCLQEGGVHTLTSHIGQLTRLKRLYCYGDRELQKPLLTSISSEIGNCVLLEELLLEMNDLRDLPDTVVNLTNLWTLTLGDNKLCNPSPGWISWADTYDPGWDERQCLGGVASQIDFGAAYGLWTYHRGEGFEKLHSLPSEEMVTADLDGNGISDTIIDFGAAYGIWARMNDSSWVQIHLLSPEEMATGNLDDDGNPETPEKDELIIDFGSQYGIWVHYNNVSWDQLHTVSPEHMATGSIGADSIDDLLIDFGSDGIHVWGNNLAWIDIHCLSSEGLLMGDLDGNGLDEMIIDFGTEYGIFAKMNGYGGEWVQIHATSPEEMAVGDLDGGGRDDLLIDFNSTSGIWSWMNNSTWEQVHSLSSEGMAIEKP